MPPTSKARLVLTALIIEHQSPAEIAARYGVHRSWVCKLKAGYEAEGQAALEPRSRAREPPRPRPHPRPPSWSYDCASNSPSRATTPAPRPSAGTLAHHHEITLSRATIHRLLSRHGAVTPEPAKRPKSSYLRFESEQPNEPWQSDFTR